MPQEMKNSMKNQLSKDKTMIFVLVSVAAVVVVGSLMVGKGLLSQANYLSRVAEKKEAAVTQLEANKQAVTTLTASYQEFISREVNMLAGKSEGDEERDGTNDSLVLDALPSKYDFPAVASSIERLLSGYTINSIMGTDDNLNQQAVQPGSGVVEIPFQANILTNYKKFKTLTSDLNKSIRPFHILKLDLRGTDTNLDISIQGKTFYQPETGLKITEEEVL